MPTVTLPFLRFGDDDVHWKVKTSSGTSAYAMYADERADGVTFLHVAVVDRSRNPLNGSAAFAEFQSHLVDRCVVPPSPTGATLIGQYGLDFGESTRQREAESTR